MELWSRLRGSIAAHSYNTMLSALEHWWDNRPDERRAEPPARRARFRDEWKNYLSAFSFRPGLWTTAAQGRSVLEDMRFGPADDMDETQRRRGRVCGARRWTSATPTGGSQGLGPLTDERGAVGGASTFRCA